MTVHKTAAFFRLLVTCFASSAGAKLGKRTEILPNFSLFISVYGIAKPNLINTKYPINLKAKYNFLPFYPVYAGMQTRSL